MNKKIALIADIHGNLTALEAVLEDAVEQGVDEYWILGDLFMPGSGSTDILDCLNAVSPTVWLKGNWDDCLLAVVDKEIDCLEASDVYLGMLASHILPNLKKEEIEFIRNMDMQRVLKYGETTFSLTHHLPTQNFGGNLMPAADQSEFDKLFSETIDVAVYAHIHHQTLRYSTNDQIIINPGSVGQSFNAWKKMKHDNRAQYSIIDVNERNLGDIAFRKVSYDTDRELERARKSDLPFYHLYEELIMTGKIYTHNNEVLEKSIQKNNYREKLTEFLSKV